MRKDYVDITLVIDKSGSMQDLAKDTIGGVNRFLSDQRKVDGKAHLSMYFFDSSYHLKSSADVKYTPDLTSESYRPSGNTALIDATANAIIATGNRLRNIPESERPAKVLFVIITDGQENWSKDFTKHQLRSMIKEQTDKYSWEFSYLGANVDSFTEAQQMGIPLAYTSNYGANTKGIGETYAIMSNKLETLRSRTSAGLSATMSFTPDEQDKLNQTVTNGD